MMLVPNRRTEDMMRKFIIVLGTGAALALGACTTGNTLSCSPSNPCPVEPGPA